MKKLTLLFPGSFMNYREIDEDMLEECRSAEGTGLFTTVLFNYDEWLQGDRLRLNTTDKVSKQVIYRGWMLKPKEYAKLYSELSGNGILLLTRPSEYEEMHLFPNVYPHIEADTAGMMIFEDGKVDIEAVKRQYPRFMVKDSVKSVKGTEFPAFFDSKVTQDEFDIWMEVFYKYRGNLLTGSICIKEYLDLKRYNGRTNEFRVFYADHKIISICRNSLQPDHTAEPPEEFIKKYNNLGSPYYTVDYAELSDGSWKIIEAGDGGVSGLSPGQDAGVYYRALYWALVTEKGVINEDSLQYSF